MQEMRRCFSIRCDAAKERGKRSLRYLSVRRLQMHGVGSLDLSRGQANSRYLSAIN